jgi:ribosomal protein L16 Arg81 hydroxylase
VLIFDELLEAGDFLFVPGGNWHRCENGPGRSLHLGIFFQPPTAWHFIKALTSELLADETFRTPLTRIDDASDLATLEADFKERAIENIVSAKTTPRSATNASCVEHSGCSGVMFYVCDWV